MGVGPLSGTPGLLPIWKPWDPLGKQRLTVSSAAQVREEPRFSLLRPMPGSL